MNARPYSVTRTVLAALTTLTTCALCLPSLLADDSNFPDSSPQHCTIRGTVRRVDPNSGRLVMVGDDDQVYTVDAYGARIILADITRRAETGDLERGMRVRASGTLVNGNLVEAMTVREVSDYTPSGAVHTVRAVAPPVAASTTVEGVIRLVDPDHSRITVTDVDGARDVVDTYDASIVLTNRATGQTADLVRGMHVQVAGTRLADDRLVADRVRVLPDITPEMPPIPAPAAELPQIPVPLSQPAPRYGSTLVPPSPDPQYVLAHLDEYTGILIDARHLSAISRSPAPAVFGPEPSENLLYPDRGHVPTPDQVQDESIVRYYHTEADSHTGVAGDNPLILPAQAVLTPAQDALQLSADDMVLFNALEKRLHFSRTWKVGFLIPGDK